MALKKSIVMPQGYEVKDAYFRIENLSLHGKEAMTYNIRGYADTSKPSFIEFVHSCNYELNGKNPIEQAYENAKTTPDFEGCEDC